MADTNALGEVVLMTLVLGGLAIAQYQAQCQGSTTTPTCRWRFAAIVGFTFVLVTSRTNLLPLLALPLLLLCQRFSGTRLAAFVLLCAASLGWTLFVLLTTMDARIERSHTTLHPISDRLRFLCAGPLTLRQQGSAPGSPPPPLPAPPTRWRA